jgi:hypothetical protein
MVKNTPVDITIKDNTTGAYFRIPVLPQRISYTDGEKKAHTVEILNLGPIDFPYGVDLDEISWSSFFPRRYDPSYCAYENLPDPITARNLFSTWKDRSTSLQVICPVFGINKTMYLKSFPWSGEGFECDIYYQVTFRELKAVKPQQLTPGSTAQPKGKQGPASRPPLPKKPVPKTYKAKPGESPYRVDKKLGLAPGTTYSKNKAAIGPNPARIKPELEYRL